MSEIKEHADELIESHRNHTFLTEKVFRDINEKMEKPKHQGQQIENKLITDFSKVQKFKDKNFKNTVPVFLIEARKLLHEDLPMEEYNKKVLELGK